MRAATPIPFKRMGIEDVSRAARSSRSLREGNPSCSRSCQLPARLPPGAGTGHVAKASSFAIACPDACGIDLGSSSHCVAVPANHDEESVRELRDFTAALQARVAWLRQCQITALAMESTGVYWIPLYEMLDEAGFEVHLVKARHVKSVPGRKSDVLDCQWHHEGT